MKRMLLAIVVLCCSLFAIAAEPNTSLLQGLKSPATEIAELEDLIAKAKASDQTPDPAWTTRIRELIPMVKGHASKVPADLEAFQVDRGFTPGAVIRPTDLTPLEQQIKELEFQIDGGFSSVEPDEITRLNLKDQLNDLYSQRVVRDPANPLDQGNDICPATPINGLPYTDTGTTSGRANNFSPAQIGGACFNNNAPDVIYSFVPPYTQSYTITTDGSSYDTYIYIQRFGTCPGDSTLECNDDGGIGVNSLITRTLTAGVTYHIIVDGYGASSGNYVLNVFDNCNIECQPGDIQECFEVRDSTHLQNNCNGGCENPLFGGVESWQDIQPCQTVCGRLFTGVRPNGGNYRDVDTYRFTLTEACSLAITLNSEVGYTLVVTTANCPWSFLWTYTSYPYPCSTATHVTPCFQPGTYSVMVRPNTFTGINDFRTYRMQVGLIPCSGCRVDAFFQAPGSAAWNTCGAGNDNSLRSSEDYTFCVNIPYDGEWTFSMCGGAPNWDSYLYLSTQCNGGVIAENDYGCGGVGLSVISCLPLTAGTYYLTVEGYFEDDCGPFTLSVFECLGSCCYGDPLFPACDYISQSDCNALGGAWTAQEPCSTGACYTRPDCGNGEVIFSQLPIVPGEPFGSSQSDSEGGFRVYEDYSVSSAIGSIRFWGVFGYQECDTVPHGFEITFIDSVNNQTQTYNVTLTANELPLVYFGVYQLLEYTAELNPPCTITDGWLSIAETSSPSCYFNWFNTVLGNGQLGYTILQNESQYEIVQLPVEMAFCLSAGCVAPDSVTIKLFPDVPDAYTLSWWQPTGVIRAWWSTNPTAVFPATYTELFNFYVPEGSYSNSFFAPDPSAEVIYVLTVDCGVPTSAAGVPTNPVLMKQEESK